MFKRKKKDEILSDHDAVQILDTIDKIIAGNFSGVNPVDFNNPEYGEKLNKMLHVFTEVNNPVVMRLNETMGVIGDNTLIKNTLEQVESQTKSIQHMENSSQHLESSIENISDAMGDIRTNTHKILSVSQNITTDMNDSIKAVNKSSEKISTINQNVQDFKGKINKIEEIVDIVQNVASQSNLLALNASIEAARAGDAGRGFAVVAEQIRVLAEQSKDAVAHIEDVTKNVVGAVENLAVDAKKLLDFVGTDVVSNFEGFSGMADNYSKDAGTVDELVTDFSASAEELLASINGVISAINDVSTATTQGASGTTEIAQKATSASKKSVEIKEKAAAAHESADELRKQVEKFTI